jgi:hypothetical protein
VLMDIKIIPGEEGTRMYPVSKDVVLMVRPQDVDRGGTGGVIPFSRVDYYLYHLKKNIREEILPDIEKYMVANFYFCEKEVSEIYFFHIEYTTYPVATFLLFSYNIHQQVCKEVYRFEDNLKLYERDKKIDLFMLNSNYFLMQIQMLASNSRNTYKGFLRFSSFLYDRNNRMRFEIHDQRLKKYGIMQMVLVANNVCALRLGYNLIDEERYAHLMKGEAAQETIGLISVSQFIGDILLKLPTVSMEIIDEVYWDKTFSEIRREGKYVVFSRVSREDFSQEIIFYQYITKETMMLLNKNKYAPEKLFPSVLLKSPYIIKERKKFIEFYNISKNMVDVRLPIGTRILNIQNDMLVLQITKKGLFSGSREEFLEVYQFSGMKQLYKEKVRNLQVLSTTPDNLLIFIQERSV